MSEVDELRARQALMVGERQRLVLKTIKEQRPLSPSEIEEIAALTTAISGVMFTLNELAPPPPPQPTLVPNPDYRLVAAEILARNKTAWQMAQSGASDWGRWLITTIAGVHLGGLYIISTAPSTIDALSKSRGSFALGLGLILILLAGLASWRNFANFSDLYYKWSNPNMLVDASKQPTADELINQRIEVSYRWSYGLGIASAACIPVAFFLVLGWPH